MNIIAFGKTMKFVKKYCNDKVLANDKRRSYLLSQPNYNITGQCSKNKEMKKPKVVIKKPTYKGFSIVTSLE